MAVSITIEGTDTSFLTEDFSEYDQILDDYYATLENLDVSNMFANSFPDYEEKSLDELIDQLAKQSETIGESSADYVPPTLTEVGGAGDYRDKAAADREANYDTTVNEDGSITQTPKAQSPSAATRTAQGLSVFSNVAGALSSSPTAIGGLIGDIASGLSKEKGLADTIDGVYENDTDLAQMQEDFETLGSVNTGWGAKAMDVFNGVMNLGIQNYTGVAGSVASYQSKNEVAAAHEYNNLGYLNESIRQQAAVQDTIEQNYGVTGDILGYGSYSTTPDTSSYGFDSSSSNDFGDYSFGDSSDLEGSFDLNTGYSGWGASDSVSDSSTNSTSGSSSDSESASSSDDSNSSDSGSSNGKSGIGGDQDDRG